MSKPNDLEKAISTEHHRAELFSVYAAREWCAREGGQTVVVCFEFRAMDGDQEFRRKIRLYSKFGEKREKAVITLREIDRAVNAGGVLRKRITAADLEALIDAAPDGRAYLHIEEEVKEYEPVRIIYAHHASIHSRSDRPFVSSYVSRVHQWIPEFHMSIHQPESAAPSVKDFCWSREWLIVRKAVIDTMGAVCMCCGATKLDAVITVDHVKSRSRFPALALSPSNMQVLCRECNEGKGDKSEMDYRDGPQYERLVALENVMQNDGEVG